MMVMTNGHEPSNYNNYGLFVNQAVQLMDPQGDISICV